MKPCINQFLDPNSVDLWYPGTFYCPEWTDDHVLYNTYRGDIHTWIRLSVHRCDPERRALMGKECATDDKIDEFFSKNIFNMQMSRQAPDLDFDTREFAKRYSVDIWYSNPVTNVSTQGKEFVIKKNKVVLEDNLLGIIDN